MNDVVRIRPVEGRLILMPDRQFQPVPKEGARVFLDPFYVRTINQGDVEVVPDEPVAAAPATPTK